MNCREIILYSLLVAISFQGLGQDVPSEKRSNFSLRGYLKEMPAVQTDNRLNEAIYFNLIHNRLNFRMDYGRHFHFSLEMRNRLFTNEIFQEVYYFKEMFGYDPGFFDMSWVWLYEGNWLGHTMIDRLYADWRSGEWQVRAGRQRINWGINLISNPNDLFNTYSFFDFDYVERPGTDAVRVQWFLGPVSRLQFAVSPAKNSRDMVAATMLNLNQWNYDCQILAGYYHNRSALGLGWAGHIGGAGFKGEATWFYDIEKNPGIDRGNLVAAAGVDYLLKTGTFAAIEFLYNGGHNRIPTEVVLVTQPLRADDIMFSEFSVTLSAQHPFSAILNGGLAVMVLPDISGMFIMPNITYSVMTNLDLQLLLQYFTGDQGSVIGNSGLAGFLMLQYSF